MRVRLVQLALAGIAIPHSSKVLAGFRTACVACSKSASASVLCCRTSSSRRVLWLSEPLRWACSSCVEAASRLRGLAHRLSTATHQHTHINTSTHTHTHTRTAFLKARVASSVTAILTYTPHVSIVPEVSGKRIMPPFIFLVLSNAPRGQDEEERRTAAAGAVASAGEGARVRWARRGVLRVARWCFG